MKISPNQARQSWPKHRAKVRKSSGFSEAVRQIISRRSAGMCELDFCGPAEQYHHRAPRQIGGTRVEWVNAAANALHVSLGCHNRIERWRSESLDNGWLVSRIATAVAAEVPVLYRGRWVLLSDDGRVTPATGGAA